MAAKEPQSNRGFLIGAACVAIILVGGWMAYPHIKEYLDSRPDTGDYRSDIQLVDQLRTAPLPSVPPPSSTNDWPQWRGPNRDGLSTETGLLAGWPAGGPRTIWESPTGMGYACPAIAGGKVYLLVQDGDNEAVVCLNAADGKEIWGHRYPALFTNFESGTGPHATPLVDGDRLYTVGATGMFFCLDAATGKPHWSHDILKEANVQNQEYGTSFSPLIEGELVITMPGGPNGNSIVAYDKKDGHLVWKNLDDRAGYSSPVAATIAGKRQLVFLTAENVVGLSAQDGKLLWRYPWPLFKDCNIATPIVTGDYVFVASGYSKGCALLHIEPSPSPPAPVPPGERGEGKAAPVPPGERGEGKAAPVPPGERGEGKAAPVPPGERGEGKAAPVPPGERGEFIAKPVYEHNRMRSRFSTSVLYKDHLYGFDEFFLVCMEYRTGKVLWKKRGFGEGSLAVADDKLIIMSDSGQLVLADASPEKFQERSSVKMFDGRCWTVPVLAGGKLYVRDEKTIRCLDVKGQP